MINPVALSILMDLVNNKDPDIEVCWPDLQPATRWSSTEDTPDKLFELFRLHGSDVIVTLAATPGAEDGKDDDK